MALPHPKSIAHYDILGELGRGGMGVVYKAKAHKDGELCALKIITPEHLSRPESALRFKREFRAMQRVQHPNVVRVYTSGTHDECPFFTMEIVEGQDIKAWLDGSPPIVPPSKGPPPAGRLSDEQRSRLNDPARVQRLAESIIQVGFALGAIHKNRIVHRDLKPDNVLVSTAGVVKLMDFGIAKQLTGHSEHSSGGVVVGTFKYLSPEQALGNEVDGRADLYCLGIILYELLAGRHPFYSENSVGYAYHHARNTPPPIERFNPEVHPGLQAVCEKLIQKDPNDRFPTAEDVIQAIRQAVFGEADKSDAKESPKHAERADVFAPAHIGRIRETGAIMQLCEQLKEGRGRVSVISGPTQIGKSRLIREAAGQARALDVEFVVADALRDANAPYQPYVELLDRIIDGMAEKRADEVHNLLGDDAPALARYLPSIERLGSAALTRAAGALEPDAERLRFMDAVASFLGRISRIKPRVLVIENFERADELSHQLTQHLAETVASAAGKGSARDGRIGLMLTVDPTDEKAEAALKVVRTLRKQAAARHLELGALDAEQVREMLVTMIGGGDVASAVGEVLHQATGGVPGLVEQRIRAMAEAGELRRQGREWVLLKRAPRAPTDPKGRPPSRAETASLPAFGSIETGMSGEASSVIQLRAATRADIAIPDLKDAIDQHRRVARLSKVARDVGERAAVAGDRVFGTVIERLALRRESELLDALNELLEKKVLVEDREGLYRFTSVDQRKALLDNLEGSRLENLHQRAARALEEDARATRRPIEPEILARHWKAGGEPLKALVELMTAARRALEAGATQTAAERVREAQEIFLRDCAAKAHTPEIARRDADLVVLRLDVLAAVGEHKECVSLARRRLPRLRGVVDSRLVAEILLRLARSERALWQTTDALSHVSEALAITDRGAVHSLRCRAKSLAGAIYAQRGQYDHAERYHKEALELARAIGDSLEEDLARSAIAERRLDVGDLYAAERAFKSLLATARQRGERIRTSSYLNALGVIHHERAEYDDAERLYQEAISLAKPAGNRRAVGVGVLNRAVVYRDRGQYDEALSFCRRAYRILKMIDDKDTLAYIRIVEAQTCLLQGDAKRARSAADKAYERAEGTGSSMNLAEASIARALARARLGEDLQDALDEARRGTHAAREVQLNRIVLFGLLAEAEILSRMGSAQEATITLREGLARAQETEFVRFSRRAEALAAELGIKL
jgi:predicted ATPase/tRNA A-37 threonylcarbamoyl transferase component Bud32